MQVILNEYSILIRVLNQKLHSSIYYRFDNIFLQNVID